MQKDFCCQRENEDRLSRGTILDSELKRSEERVTLKNVTYVCSKNQRKALQVLVGLVATANDVVKTTRHSSTLYISYVVIQARLQPSQITEKDPLLGWDIWTTRRINLNVQVDNVILMQAVLRSVVKKRKRDVLRVRMEHGRLLKNFNGVHPHLGSLKTILLSDVFAQSARWLRKRGSVKMFLKIIVLK